MQLQSCVNKASRIRDFLNAWLLTIPNVWFFSWVHRPWGFHVRKTWCILQLMEYFFPFYLVPIIMFYDYILHNAFFQRYFWQRNDFLWGQMPLLTSKDWLQRTHHQAVCFSELWGKGWVTSVMSDGLQFVLIINGGMLVIHIKYIIDVAGGLVFIPDGS